MLCSFYAAAAALVITVSSALGIAPAAKAGCNGGWPASSSAECDEMCNGGLMDND